MTCLSFVFKNTIVDFKPGSKRMTNMHNIVTRHCKCMHFTPISDSQSITACSEIYFDYPPDKSNCKIYMQKIYDVQGNINSFIDV